MALKHVDGSRELGTGGAGAGWIGILTRSPGVACQLCSAWPGPGIGEEGTEEKRSTRLPEASKEPSKTQVLQTRAKTHSWRL